MFLFFLQFIIVVSIIIIVIDMKSDYEEYIPKHASNYTDCYGLKKNGQMKKQGVKKKKKRRRIKKWVWNLLIFFFLAVIIGVVICLLSWNKDNVNTSKVLDEIGKDVEIIEREDTENTENINEPDDKESDYWYYITFPLINVRFDELIKKNNDTIAWINVNHTNINYPVVQAKDNDYYLTHSYDKSTNEAGWVFLDFRNKNDFSDKNNIIYAHSRLDKTMFGSLSRVLKSDWYMDKSNHVIRISTPSADSLWQIFSVYVVKEESYYITTEFSSDNSYVEFLNTIRDRSKYDFKTELNATDRIITLSTCYSDTERTVVHAKLIKRSLRN